MASFTSEVLGLHELVQRFGQLPAEARGYLRQAMEYSVDLVEQAARENMARLFHPRTGRMESSLSTKIEETSEQITGTVTASGLPYLAIHEYGGVIQTPEIFPVNALALHWISPAALPFKGTPGQEGVFAMHTAAHPTPIPERSYMRAALAQRRREIEAAFQGHLTFGGLS